MDSVCKKCGHQINANDKFCTNCGNQLTESEVLDKMDEIIVSTGDIKRDYDVLRPIHTFHLSLNDKESNF